VADWYDHKVRVINTKTLKVIKEISVGKSPAGIDTDLKNSKFYVANRDDHTVSVVNIKNFKEEKILKAGKRPFAVTLTPDNKFLYVVFK